MSVDFEKELNKFLGNRSFGDKEMILDNHLDIPDVMMDFGEAMYLKALDEYGKHTDDCPYWMSKPCLCGFEEALLKLKEQS